MKELVESLREIRPHYSYMVVLDEVERDYFLEDKIAKELKALKFFIWTDIKSVLKGFLDENGVEYKKRDSVLTLAKRLGEYAKSNKKHLVINVWGYGNKSELSKLQEVLTVIYNTMLEQSSEYSYYPVVIAKKREYKDIINNSRMWRYKPYFLKDEFLIDYGVWKEKHKCRKCKKETEILVGIRTKTRIFFINSFNMKLKEFLKEAGENVDIVFKENKICNRCSNCGAIIDNSEIFDKHFSKHLNNGFEDIQPEMRKIDYRRLKECIKD